MMVVGAGIGEVDAWCIIFRRLWNLESDHAVLQGDFMIVLFMG
jgi:hypothetical protein